MVDIFSIIYLVVGIGSGYIISEVMLRKNKALYTLSNALKKKKFVAFLETDKAIYCRIIQKIYRNLAITKQKEIIILPKSSPKPCVNLGGAMIIHGDLYKSVAVPQELRKFIRARKKEGWKEEDIAQFLEEVETTSPNTLKQLYLKLKEGKKPEAMPESEAGSNPAVPTNSIDKRKYDVYINLPSVVKDFIYTGLNRVSIHAMLRELVYQRELEKMGKHNWLMIAIAIMVILLGVGFAIRFIFSSPGVLEVVSKVVSPPRIAP